MRAWVKAGFFLGWLSKVPYRPREGSWWILPSMVIYLNILGEILLYIKTCHISILFGCLFQVGKNEKIRWFPGSYDITQEVLGWKKILDLGIKEVTWGLGGRQCPAHRSCRISLAHLQGPEKMSQQRGDIQCAPKVNKTAFPNMS